MPALINQVTGDIDPMVLAEAIQQRAMHEGGERFSAGDLRRATEWWSTRAQVERRQWLRSRGLPVPGEEPENMTRMADYGCGND